MVFNTQEIKIINARCSFYLQVALEQNAIDDSPYTQHGGKGVDF